jgi:hypothetical protein
MKEEHCNQQSLILTVNLNALMKDTTSAQLPISLVGHAVDKTVAVPGLVYVVMM